MRWNALAAVVCAAAMAIGPGVAEAQEGVRASECCVTLVLPVGARALGLGNAMVARPVADALFVNPSAAALLPKSELRVHSERTDLANTTTMSLLFGLGSVGVAGLSYRLVDYGEQELTDIDVVKGTLHPFEQLLGVSFATRAAGPVRAGVHYKLFQLRNDCSGACDTGDRFSATTHLVDLGVQLDAPWVNQLHLGAALLNVGPKMQVLNADQADPPPTRLRIGAAHEILQYFRPDTTMQLMASVDLNTGASKGIESGASVGLELVLDRSLFVRTGYATGTGNGTGGSVGVGLLYDRFDIGVAKSFASSQDGGEPFQVTFAIRF